MKALGLALGRNGTASINALLPTTGTAINGATSQGTLTIDTQPLADDTMTIGTKVYTFVTDETATADGEIDVGADLADAKVQIVAAINGTDHNTASTVVTAAAFATNDCVLTAIAGGVVGDSVATTETFDAVTNVFDAATLGTTTAGIDGTAGRDGEQLIDATYLYVSIDVSTIGVGNWRRMALGSAF